MVRIQKKDRPLSSHSQRAHALLSASGASRWLNCTPSAKLEEEHGEKKTSVYAQEGTLAHELSELYLRKDVLESISESEFLDKFDEIMSNELFTEDMPNNIEPYVNYCTAQLAAAKEHNPLACMEIEQKLDLTEYVPESFGTADCVIIDDDVMEVIDLKYGKGVPVYATWNRQLMLYGLGALRKFDTMYDITKVRLTIVQPRIDNISSFEISVEELVNWAEEELKPRAEMAFNGEGELNAGDWCKFCAVKNRCRKLYEQALEVAKLDFAEPELLTDEEVSELLKLSPRLVDWLNSVTEYAGRQAIEHNKAWPGFKLVAGRSMRKWIDEDKAIEAILTNCPELSEEDIFNMKLKSITTLEKLLGKARFAATLSEVVIKPEGKPTLVPLEDKRPALGLEDAINDFKN